MRRALCSLPRDGIERSRKLVGRELQSECIGEHIAILALVCKRPPLHLACCDGRYQPGVEQGDPGPVGPGTRAIRLLRWRLLG